MKFHVLLSILILTGSFAYGDEAGGGNKDRVGPGKAVEAANATEGFKLSERAFKGMSLTLEKVRSQTLTVPSHALVSFQDFAAIYRLRDGWLRLVEIEPRIQGGLATFSTKELKPGDEIVVQGGNLLRVIDLDIFGPEADACVD